MEVKLKSDLKAEEMSVRVLLVAAISLFCVSCMIEFVLQDSMCGFSYQSKHLDFFNSVALGLAGSALISFLSLWFQFRDRRKTQIRDVTSVLLGIYTDYALIYHLIQNGTDPQFIGDDYCLEKELSGRAAVLKRKISEADIVYRNASFISENVNKVLCTFQNDIMFNLRCIETFCEAMLPVSDTEPQKVKEEKAPSEGFAQDIIVRRARKECCKYILSIIDQRCTVIFLEKMLSKLGLETELSSCAASAIKGAEKAVYAICLATLECKQDISIRMSVAQLFNRHTQEYFTESYAVLKRLDRVVKQIEAKKRTDPQLFSAVSRVNELVRCDKLSEAGEIIGTLENSIEEI